MNIKLYGFLIFLLFPFLLWSQIDRSNYELLWEINGNGLAEPSYLLGTIHLKDERVFEFSDSLYYKLEQCKALAIEVHPDSINNYLLDLYSNRDTINTLKESLSPNAYDDINKLLFERVGKTIEELANKNPFLIKMMLRQKADEKPTDKDLFMDLFLYRMARNQGKQTFGLEKIEDHKNLTSSYFRTFENNEELEDNFLVRKYNSIVKEDPFESLINLYLTGDLGLIQLLTQFDEEDEYQYELITKRNHIIADNIDQLIHQQSTFNAIGAAHLPGKDGVIELLRNKGYNMRPVTAAFTGKAANYQYEKSAPIWYPFQTDFYRYRISFPGKPYKLDKELRHRLISNVQLFNDIVEEQFYSAISVLLFTNEGVERDSFLIDEIKARYLKKDNYKLLSTKKIETDSIECIEFKVQKDIDNFLIGRAFQANDNLYFITVERSDEHFENRDIQRFFDSFHLEDPIHKSWVNFYDEKGAFSARLPHEPNYQLITEEVEDLDEIQKYSLHVYMASNLEEAMTFLIRYNDLPEGMVSENDTIFYHEIKRMFEEKTGEEFNSTIVYKDGYEGREFIYTLDSLFIRIQAFLRGNRMYFVLGQSLGAYSNIETIEDFFNNFKFEPFLPATFSEYSYEDDGFSVRFPKAPTITKDTFSSYNFPYEYYNIYATTDANSGSVYGLTTSTFSEYHREESLDSMLNRLVQETPEFADSLLEATNLTISNLPAKKLKVQSPLVSTTYNSVIVVKGNKAYEIFIYSNKECTEEEINAYLTSLSIDESPSSFNLFESKIEKIIQDLQSTDGDVRKKAKTGLSNYALKQEELPFIYAAFQKDYPEDTLGYTSVFEILCDHLALVNDENTISFLNEKYYTSTNDSEKQIAILTTIGNLEKTDSISVFFKLANDYKEVGDNENYYYYSVFEPFHDSLNLAVRYFPQLMELGKQKAFRGQIASITNTVLMDDSLESNFIQPYKSEFCSYASEIVQRYELLSKDTVDYFSDYWVLSNLIDIIGQLSFDEKSAELFDSLLDLNSQSLRASVMLALIKNDKKVGKKNWDYIFTDLYEWHNLLLSLEKINRLDKAPSNQLNKRNVAKAALYSYIYDDYDYPSKMKILDVQPFQYQGEELSLCVMEFYYYEDDGPYVGIISQPKQKGKFNLSPKIINMSYDTFEEGNYQSEVDQLLKNYK